MKRVFPILLMFWAVLSLNGAAYAWGDMLMSSLVSPESSNAGSLWQSPASISNSEKVSTQGGGGSHPVLAAYDTPGDVKRVDSAGDVDMLIFVSPQYANDTKINSSITNYIQAVRDDVGWSSEIIRIGTAYNSHDFIDSLIEKYDTSFDLKACIMVGEDMNTGIELAGYSGTNNEFEGTPNVSQWTDTEVTPDDRKMSSVDVVVSLLYPSSNLDYTVKAEQLESVFERFATDRDTVYPDDIQVVTTQERYDNHKQKFDKLDDYGQVSYIVEGATADIKNTLDNSYQAYIVSGHASPSAIGSNVVSTNGDVEFHKFFGAEDVKTINTPLLVGDGCYSGGWHFEAKSQLEDDLLLLDSDDNKAPALLPSKDENWFGNGIFTNSDLRVEILGLPLLQGPKYGDAVLNRDLIPEEKWNSYPNFIYETMPDLKNGKTLAESMLGDFYNKGDFMVYGDPTFHYNFDSE